MPAENAIRVTADIKRRTFEEVKTVTMNDSIPFIVTITNDGQPFPLTDITIVTLLVSRLDGVDVPLLGAIVEGENAVRFDLSREATGVSGRTRAVVQLYDANQNRVSTVKGHFDVENDPSGDSFTPTVSDKTLIEEVLYDGPSTIVAAQTATLGALESAEVADEAVSTLTGSVGGAISSLNTDKAQALQEMDDKKAEVDVFLQDKATEFVDEQDVRTDVFNQSQFDREQSYTAFEQSKETEFQAFKNAKDDEVQTVIGVADTKIAEVEQVASDNVNIPVAPVDTIALRNSTYPNPQHGTVVNVLQGASGMAETYRFKTGAGWGLIDKQNATTISNITSQLADMAKHHKNDNLLAKMQRKEPVVIVCYGDSMTWGYVSAGVQVAEPYPAVLQRKLRYLYGYEGITVFNEGMSGTTSNGGNANYDARVAVHNPDLAIIMYGLNDNNATLDINNFQDNLRSMIKKGKEKGIETILLSPTPTNLPDSQYNLENINYTKAVKSIANEKDIDFVDLNAEFSNLFKQNAFDQRNYESGSVHFKQDGYTLIADMVIKESLYPYVRADYKNKEFLSFQSPFVKNNVTASLVRATSKLQKFFYVKDTSPTLKIGFAIFNDVPNAKFKMYVTRDMTGGTINMLNFGNSYATLSNNGEFLIDHEVEFSLGIGLHYFELVGANVEVGKQFVTSGGYIVEPSVIDSALQTLTLQNGWLNSEGVYEVARVYKSAEGKVTVEGMIKSGTMASSTVIATLPSGYRPLKTQRFLVASSDGTSLIPATLEIESTGNVVIRGTMANNYLSLSGIAFLSGQ